MRADKSHRDIKPWKRGTPLPVSLTFDPQDFERIRNGVIPREMEDRWFAWFEEPWLYVHRSWTGLPCYRVRFAVRDRGVVVDGAEYAGQLDPDSRDETHYHASMVEWLLKAVLLRRPASRPPLLRIHNAGGAEDADAPPGSTET